jgi:hypothetical protein
VIRGARDVLRRDKPLIYFELVPLFLRKNNEEVMSIFIFLQKQGYSDVILCDNYGYLLNQIKINDIGIRQIEMLIGYIESKGMYLDVLASVEEKEIDEIYISEKQAIAELLNSKKKNTLHGYYYD